MTNQHGWIIYNGNLPSNDFLDLAEWLHESAIKFNLSTEIIANNHLFSYLENDTLEIIRKSKQPLPDFVIFTDKDIYLAKQLELLGIRVFNSSEAIHTSDDKIITYQQLAMQQLPIPETIIAPKVFSGFNKTDSDFFEYIIEKLKLPLIIKESFGSFGEQVYLIHTREEMIQKTIKLGNKPFVYQKFIASSYGKDIRLHVVGDEVVASMLRRSASDFRANITAGGKTEAYTPTEHEQELAILATKAIGADFAGVDLLFGPNNTPIICEVNSNAHIRNMYDCTNINVADFIIKYIINTIKTGGE